ncbi:hypothetical protein FA13DRAFT_1785061 [Coprinellus micaceus]|uniref:FAM86 N-terminal domain-containing protein n=1 Tax=Coprinellus micaceus TaxID=71717 RepID=A0A4Y7TX73_COPMI|nr:hypothetical protein FA13DRAFT_1785061 [Coprinellus micaceus]
MSEQALFAVLRRYSYLAPPNRFEFPQDIALGRLQEFLVEKILHNDLLTTYAPSAQYQKTFWRRVIDYLEKRSQEACGKDPDFELSEEIYDHYVELLHSPVDGDGSLLRGLVPSRSFVTYHWQPPGIPGAQSYITTTLLESRNMIESGTTGLRTWTAAFFLAQYLLDNPETVLGKSILELGSGIGFMGIVIASLQVLCRAQDMPLPKLWLTDVDETVLLTCRRNLELPCNLSFSHDAVKTVRIDWFEALDDIAAPRLQSIICEEMDPELIIGSDIVFDPHLIRPLLATVKLAMGGSRKVAIFAVTVRNEATISNFLSSAQDMGLDVEDVPYVESRNGWILPNDVVEDISSVRLLKFSARR